MFKLKIVDAHVHWWDLDNHLYPWLNGNNQARDQQEAQRLANNYLPEDLDSDAKRYELSGAVHIEAGYDPAKPTSETRWLDSLETRFPFVILGSANLANENLNGLLNEHKRSPNFRGVRHMLNFVEGRPELCWADQNYLDNPLWKDNYPLLGKHGLIFELMCFGHQMEDFARLAKAHPEIPVVLEHTGMPSADGANLEKWRSGIKALSQCGHVHCKLGGLGTMIPDWNEEIAFHVFDWVLECFGPERIMFASNFPTDSQFTSYDYMMDIIISWAESRLSHDQQNAFWANNALTFYKF